MSAVPSPITERQQVFERVYLPVLVGTLKKMYRRLDPDAQQEAVQDGVAAAWRTVVAIAPDRVWDGAGDRQGKTTPGTLVNFICRRSSTGRSAISSSVCDPLDPQCQQLGRAKVRDFEAVTAEADAAHEDLPAAMLSRPTASPAEQVRARLDWSEIGRACPRQARRVLMLLVRGFRGVEIAKRLGISPAAVCYNKERIAAAALALGYCPT